MSTVGIDFKTLQLTFSLVIQQLVYQMSYAWLGVCACL
jgi:hypothetical protein